MSEDFIPRQDGLALTWMQAFSSGLSASPGTYMQSQADCDTVAAAVAAYAAAYAAAMNPATRTLLQVKIEDAVEADDILSRLMGDEVEPRREFIEQNALYVQNLDV